MLREMLNVLFDGVGREEQVAYVAIALVATVSATLAVRLVVTVVGERRTALRQLLLKPVEVSWLDAAGWVRNARGCCRNCSTGGVGLELPVPIEVSTRIDFRVCGAEMEGKGVVRHCRLAGRGYLVGVKFVRRFR